ncbi:MAG TPA: YdaU family protein [Methylovorus sp.]|nr:YdaU family protein [Methylovorus sp.]
MNYYERHIGDFIKDTVSLSMLEDGAYNRLIDQAYQTEQPLPLDRREIYRLARATSSAERKAVDYVLNKFWKETENGYVQKRIQAEIERYQEAQPDQESKKENTRERQRRTRERRKQIFDLLREHGIVPAYDATMQELQELLSHIPSQPVTPPVTHYVTRDVTRDATATQTPDTRHQLKPSVLDTQSVISTTPGEVCACLKAQGYLDINPANPMLIALIDAGASLAEFQNAAQAAKVRKFSYVLGTVKGQREQAAQLQIHTGKMPTGPMGNARDQGRALAAESLLNADEPAEKDITPQGDHYAIAK